jgi:hypothetical protein
MVIVCMVNHTALDLLSSHGDHLILKNSCAWGNLNYSSLGNTSYSNLGNTSYFSLGNNHASSEVNYSHVGSRTTDEGVANASELENDPTGIAGDVSQRTSVNDKSEMRMLNVSCEDEEENESVGQCDRHRNKKLKKIERSEVRI